MATQKRIKDYQEEIIYLYQTKQYSINQIAKQYAVHPSTINRLLRQTVGIRPPGMSPEQKQAIYDAYQEGYSRREIAKRFHTDPSNISRILLREFQVQPELKRNVSPYEALIPAFISDYQQGLSASQIATKYQTTHNTVLKHLRQYKESIRNLEESKRSPDLNLEYFKTLTPEKIVQLGQLWAIGSLKNRHENQLILTVESSRKERLKEVLKGWSDLSYRNIGYNRTNSCILKIGSISLCQQFETWGIRRTYPICLKPNDPNFWKGYLSLKIGFHRNSLYIGMPKGFDPSFKEDLIQFLSSLGIESEAIRYRQQGINLFKKSEVLKLLTFAPQLLTQLPSEQQSPYWKSITNNSSI